MFLFATTFYPLSVYPRSCGRSSRPSPSTRASNWSAASPPASWGSLILGHLLYFAVMIVVGVAPRGASARRLLLL